VSETTELILPGPAEALAALLDVPMPDDELPLFWHWVYMLDRPAQADLGSDGHPVRGSIPAPPEPGRRRMFAGGRVQALAPLRFGQAATRRAKVLATQEKHGRSGRLTFVTVGQQICQGGRLVIDERQHIVYRDVAGAAIAPAPRLRPPPPLKEECEMSATATPARPGSINHEQPHPELRTDVRELCARFPDEYWRRLDQAREYPQEFVDAATESRLLAALIPTEYGGLGLGLTEASIIMEEINRSGGHSAACHAQMYTMGALLRHGSDDQKRAYLPGIASGELRLQAFSITEEQAGSDTTSIATSARRDGDDYVIDGHKNWTSRVLQSDLLLLLARTASRAEHEARAEGMSLFLIDLRAVREHQPDALEVTPVRTMFNYATNQVRYRQLRVPASSLIGEEGQGFRYVIDGWNAERILLAAEAIGDGYWFTERATAYANTRKVFGRPVGANQGVQFPIAHAYMQLRAADLMRYEAARRFDEGEPCGAEANMAKLLSSEASWAAANVCLDTHGGYGFVDAYDVERKFRETRLYKVAPVNNNLVTSFVATKVLGLPRSY
jgi:acyl-CoA dehydrogenase